MNYNDILSKVDHTLLSPDANWQQIKCLIDDAVFYKTASVCIPACFVKKAKEYADGKMKICTVIGFPNGYNTTEVKIFECEDAVRNGADEIDMVANIGCIKDRLWDEILNEIKAVKTACGDKTLKVIIETCLLSDEEKIKMCHLVSQAGADFIKTSTGFSVQGATAYDVELLAKNAPNGLKVKAAGGISTLKDAEIFLKLGASRLGTSKIVKIIKSEK